MTDETIWHIATDRGGDWYADTTAQAVDYLTQGLPPEFIENRRNVLEVEFDAIARHGGTGFLPLTSHGLGWNLTVRRVTRAHRLKVLRGVTP